MTTQDIPDEIHGVVSELLRDRDDLVQLLRECPLLHTTTCNVAEKNWIAKAAAALKKTSVS